MPRELYIKNGLLKVTFIGGGYKWFRVSHRKWSTIKHYWLNESKTFQHMKLFEYHKNGTQRKVGKQIAYAGYNKETGAYYEG